MRYILQFLKFIWLFLIIFVISNLLFPWIILLNISYISFWMCIILCLSIQLIYMNIVESFDYSYNKTKNNFNTKYFYILMIWFIVILMFLSTSITQHKNYYNAIWTVENWNFEDDIKDISLKSNKIRLIDQSQATELWNKVLWEYKDGILWSQVIAWEYNIQNINGDLYWVAPLEHTNFFRFLKNKQWTPWYIKVSTYNSNDIKLVLDKPIQYQPGAYFWKNLKRHIYWDIYNKWFTKPIFNIDEKWNPYWVISIYKNLSWLYVKDVQETLIVNATTGEKKLYNAKDINSIPEWVNRIHSEEIILKQLSYWGLYKNWFFNFSWKDKKLLVDNFNLSMIEVNWISYWYAWFKSVWNDNGTVWFTLTDTLTKKTKYYMIAGSNELSAVKSANWLIQEKWYSATSPILYNILNHPTYVIPLKDNAWLTKMIALVSVKNFDIVWIWNNIDSAILNFKLKLQNNNKDKDLNSNTNNNIIEKHLDIKRISSYFDWSFWQVYIILFSNNEVTTMSLSENSNLPLYKEWDRVKITYTSTISDGLISIENLTMFKINN
jgi:hypothetical protein